MGEVIPVLIVVIFWMVMGVFALWFFRRALSVPTEMEVEAQIEHALHEAHTTDTGATTGAH